MTMIDLRSDTVTKPTPGMLEAMFRAKVGDDVYGEDPTVKELESTLARMFGKEAGLFCPSGTMTNQIAIRLHTVPGSEVICHADAHIYRYEAGGIAAHSLSSVRLLHGPYGQMRADEIEPHISDPKEHHAPLTKLVVLEDTSNRGGGAYYDFSEIEKIAVLCRKKNLALHLDGARVFNALTETKMDPKDYAKPFDTISICLSKGLGAPIGSVLLGTAEHRERAHRARKLMGGGMRQVGYLAAAGLYALEHHVARLSEDHRRAKELEQMLSTCSFVESIVPVRTNIVIFHLKPEFTAKEVAAQWREKGILVSVFGPKTLRMVTHLDVTDQMLDNCHSLLRNA